MKTPEIDIEGLAQQQLIHERNVEWLRTNRERERLKKMEQYDRTRP